VEDVTISLQTVITGVAFCPHPPALIPAVAQGAATELKDLLTQCDRAITDLASAQPDRLVLLGSGPQSRAYPPSAWGSLAGFGVPVEVQLAPGGDRGDRMPLSLTVGAWLVDRALGLDNIDIGVAVGPDFFESPAAGALDDAAGERVGLVVMGDGTARRSRAAPGYWDERAEGFDAIVLAALATGDSAALAALDLELAAELLCAGAPAWVAAGSVLSGARMHAEVRYEEAPFGVQYLVASWSARG
jgi:hypothetical protein